MKTKIIDGLIECETEIKATSLKLNALILSRDFEAALSMAQDLTAMITAQLCVSAILEEAD